MMIFVEGKEMKIPSEGKSELQSAGQSLRNQNRSRVVSAVRGSHNATMIDALINGRLKDAYENVFGALLIYSTEINSFTPDEIRLIEELASDLAFDMGVLRTRTER